VIWWIGYVLFSWLLADFIAGLFHWWEDQYAVESWPIIGTLVAGPNARHHADQTAFLQGSYWERNWTTIVPAVVVGVPFCWFVPYAILTFVFLTQANEVHAMSHRKSNRVVEALQSTGFLCSPAHHQKHHRNPFSQRFCVMSNMLNPVLDLIGFWEAIEYMAWAVSGVEPKSWALKEAMARGDLSS
jgi:hypothetical protein